MALLTGHDRVRRGEERPVGTVGWGDCLHLALAESHLEHVLVQWLEVDHVGRETAHHLVEFLKWMPSSRDIRRTYAALLDEECLAQICLLDMLRDDYAVIGT